MASVNLMTVGLVLVGTDRPALGESVPRWPVVVQDPASEFLPSGVGLAPSPALPNVTGSESGSTVGLVNTARGNLTFFWKDLSVAGYPALSLGRIYDSERVRRAQSNAIDRAAAKDFGVGWTLSVGDYVTVMAKRAGLELRTASGRVLEFHPTRPGRYAPDPAVASAYREIVEGSGGALRAQLLRGEVHTFTPSARAGVYLLSEMRDSNGSAMKLTWVGERLARIENDSGAYIEVVREGDARPSTRKLTSETRIIGLHDSLGRDVRFDYGSTGALAMSTALGGRSTYWEYDAAGRLTTGIDGEQRSIFAVTYNQDGAVQTLQTGSEITTFHYEPHRATIEGRAPLGGRTTYTHDALGRTVRTKDPAGRVRRISYSSLGDPVAVQDGRGQVTRYGFVDHLPTEIFYPDGTTEQFEYNAEGRMTRHVDARGLESVSSYDGRGNLTRERDAAGNIFVAEYSTRGDLLTSTDPMGRTTKYVYDESGRVSRMQDASGGEWKFAYDSLGYLSTVTRPDGQPTAVTFDAAGNHVSTVKPGGLRESMTYDSGGLPVADTDASGAITTRRYDAARRLSSITDPSGRVTTYEYDVQNQLTSIRFPDGTRTQFGYDNLALLVWTLNAEGERFSFRYDAEGNVIERTFPNGRTVNLEFDSRNRPIQRRFPDGTVQMFEYDRTGNLTSLRGGGFDQTMTYDAFNRLTGIYIAGTETGVTYSYDAVGRISAMQTPLGLKTAYSYDALDNLTAVDDDARGRYELGYAPGTRLRELFKSPDGRESRYAYDTGGRLESYIVHSPEGEAIEGETYRRDDAGRTLRIDRISGDAFDFVYDPVGRPFSITSNEGRRVRYSYDARGRVSQREAREGTWSYKYDSLGRPVHVVTPGESIDYRFDSRGDRSAWLILNRADQSGNESTVRWGYDGRITTNLNTDESSQAGDRRPESSRQPAPPASVVRSEGGIRRLYDGMNLVATYDGVSGASWESNLISGAPNLDAVTILGNGTRATTLGSSGARFGTTAGSPIGIFDRNGVTLRPGGDSLVGGVEHLPNVHPGIEWLTSFTYGAAFSGMEAVAESSIRDEGARGVFDSDARIHVRSVGLPLGARRGSPVAGRLGFTELTARTDLSLLSGNSSVGRRSRTEYIGGFHPGLVSRGYCDASVAGWVCLGGGEGDDDPGLPCDAECQELGGGSGGGSGGGGGGGGCDLDCATDCTFTIDPQFQTAETGTPVILQMLTVSQCYGNASWSAPGGEPDFGNGSLFLTKFAQPARYDVRATLYGQTAHGTVEAVAPACSLDFSRSPSSPTVGDSVEFSASGNCAAISWSAPGGCPATGTGSSWTTIFPQAGTVHVAASGDNGANGHVLVEKNVAVQPCWVVVRGPSEGHVGDNLCYTALTGGASSPTYEWTAPGGLPATGVGDSLCTMFSSLGTTSVSVSSVQSIPGCSAANCGNASQPIAIVPLPPSVSILSSNPTAVLFGQDVTITARGLDQFGTPTNGTYSWSTGNALVVSVVSSGSQAQLHSAGTGSTAITVHFHTATGEASAQITVHVIQVQLEQLDYRGTGNVDIRIDGTVDIGSPNAVQGDIEWVRGLRDGPNSAQPWDTSQAAPAAFIQGHPLSVQVSFAVQPPAVTGVRISGVSTGQYGGIGSVDLPVSSGSATSLLSSTASGPLGVDASDIAIVWRLESTTIGGVTIPIAADLSTTTNRIYTLKNAPLAPMDEPWATVLELSCGLARGLADDPSIIAEMTRGIHYSKWLTFVSPAHFVHPIATLVYDPSVTRSEAVGPPLNKFSHQVYDLTNFMSFLSHPEDVQQCNDNSILLGGVFLRSLGVAMTPLWIAHNYELFDSDPSNDDATDFLNPTTYYPAGRTGQVTLQFSFHQFGVRDGNVYDPSTRPNQTGDPFIAVPLGDYLDAAFPGQVSAGYISTSVLMIDLGDVSIAPMRVSAVSINEESESGAELEIVGAGFGSGVNVTVVRPGTDEAVVGVHVTRVGRVTSNLIRVSLAIEPEAANYPMELRTVRGGGGPTKRAPLRLIQ